MRTFRGDRASQASCTKSEFLITDSVDACVVEVDRPNDITIHTLFQSDLRKDLLERGRVDDLFNDSTLRYSCIDVVRAIDDL